MKKTKLLLKSLVGESGMERLEKAIFRRGTQNVADPLELYLPLLVVPRTILSWLAQNIKPLKVGEYKELEFPGQEDIKILVEKQNTDTYRGEFRKDGKVIHTFDKQTLPSIGGHFMTVGEVYDFNSEDKKENYDSEQVKIGKKIEEEHKETVQQIIADVKAGDVKPFEHYFQDIAEDHLDEYKDYYTRLVAMEKQADQEKEGDMVSAIMGMSGCTEELHQECHCKEAYKAYKYDAEKYKWFSSHETTREMVGLIGKLVDYLVSKKGVGKEIGKMLDKEELEGDPQKVKKAPYPPKEVKDPKAKEGRYLDEGEIKEVASFLRTKSKQVTHDPDVGKVHAEKAEMPAGAAAPNQAREPRAPVPASRKPAGAAAKQAQTAEKQAQASAQGKVAMAPKPKSASPVSVKSPTETPAGAPKPTVNPGANMKAEFGGRTSPNGYFRKQLSKCGVAKREGFILTEEEIFKPCLHCGMPEFTKNEDNKPQFKPCACFASEVEGKDRVFVNIEKNEKGFYKLNFNENVDPEQVKAFLMVLKTDLLIRQKNGYDEK